MSIQSAAIQAAAIQATAVYQDVEIRACPVESAARIIGQKWTLQIVHHLLDCRCKRFCELQEELGGVNPSTLSSRLKMLEDEGLVQRVQVRAIPPHVEYSLTEKGSELAPLIREVARWGNRWLCCDDNSRSTSQVWK